MASLFALGMESQVKIGLVTVLTAASCFQLGIDRIWRYMRLDNQLPPLGLPLLTRYSK